MTIGELRDLLRDLPEWGTVYIASEYGGEFTIDKVDTRGSTALIITADMIVDTGDDDC